MPKTIDITKEADMDRLGRALLPAPLLRKAKA